MEKIPAIDKIAAVDLGTYLEGLPVALMLEGKLMKDQTHAFYHWLSKYHPDQGVIDGVTVADLYVKNVIDGEMEIQDFRTSFYDVPSPVQPLGEINDFYTFEFNQYVAKQNLEKDLKYQQWADSHGIVTTVGSIMKFVDKEGYEYRVRTDIKNRGQIIR